MLERDYQSHVVKRLHATFPDAIVMKQDANYKQGIPDILILEKDKWAALEVKRSKDAPHRPNQDYYVGKANQMSYASFIYPENEEVVFNELQSALKSRRTPRVPRS